MAERLGSFRSPHSLALKYRVDYQDDVCDGCNYLNYRLDFFRCSFGLFLFLLAHRLTSFPWFYYIIYTRTCQRFLKYFLAHAEAWAFLFEHFGRAGIG